MGLLYIVDVDNFRGSADTTAPVSGEFVHYVPGVTLAQYLEARPHLKALNAAEFDELLKNFHRSLTGEVKVIDEEEFLEALEVLPPEHWVRTGGMEHFRMMEYYTATITTQYARKGGTYLSKLIDVTDESTWIKAEDFAEAKAKLTVATPASESTGTPDKG